MLTSGPEKNDRVAAVPAAKRLRLEVQGTVQGVGFRPFVYRLATELGLVGWVENSPQGVVLEIEGSASSLDVFQVRFASELPPLARIESQKTAFLEQVGYSRFTVRASSFAGTKTATVLPDVATCPDCLKEIFDPQNRRFRYPFTNCTNCGPRYSIIEALPYDRANTTMKIFPMCPECRAEYEDPANRRFHAQPNACPVCGPHIELWDKKGTAIASRYEALVLLCDALRAGSIVALKGIGGFQLLVDARNDEAVSRLRRLKNREEKPLAVMMPDIDAVTKICDVSKEERHLLMSTAAPIVLLRRRSSKAGEISLSVAPGNPYLGVMLPYSPLHHLLMAELKIYVVATSGNLSDEPICIDEHDALDRLGNIADLFLVHDRPIVRQVDDSVARIILGHPQVLRSARGFAPTAITLKHDISPILATGAHLKNSAAIASGNRVYLSQHVGDLESSLAFDTLGKVAESLCHLYDLTPQSVVCDLHPDYLSTRYAVQTGLPLTQVQHHFAHVLACMADNGIDSPVLGVSWDGTGLGSDNTIWGGEFLLVKDGSFARFGHLRPFRIPGGETAIREPRRSAIGLLYDIFGSTAFDRAEISSIGAFTTGEAPIIRKMMEQGINAPITSSAGRLFDAVASILGICQSTRFEGNAAMKVEFAAENSTATESYPFDIDQEASGYVIDWRPMIREILNEASRGASVTDMTKRFHNTLTEMIVAMATRAGEKNVVLTGGCFQNRLLTERTVARLQDEGLTPLIHRRIPPNDGGLALGQIMAAANMQTESR